MRYQRILIIQTAFIGDVILATPMIEKLHRFYPDARIDFLLKAGNEDLLRGHPKIHTILKWEKRSRKYRHLIQLIKEVRQNRYDLVVNLQRFFSTGLLTVLSGAKEKIGFHRNPFSLFFTKRVLHRRKRLHEIERNLSLISDLTDDSLAAPRLYPDQVTREGMKLLKVREYITISPASLWPTKQLPTEKWIKFLDLLKFEGRIFLLGSEQDQDLCRLICNKVPDKDIHNLAGKLTLLQSAVLMADARMNYTNDSAPMHLASAMNAPVCAVFCSTIPGFGFGPLSLRSYVVQTRADLRCRPCGLHGRLECPKGHFRCATEIDVSDLIKVLE